MRGNRLEKWPGRVNDFYRAGLKAGAFFDDWSEDFADGGDVTHIPNITEMTAHTKAINAEVTLESPQEGKIDLTIDTHYHVAFVIEDAVSAQVAKSYKAQEIYAKNAAYTVGATLEDALIALFNSFSQTVGDSSTALQDSNIRAAIAYLDTANVPEGDRAFFLHPNVNKLRPLLETVIENIFKLRETLSISFYQFGNNGRLQTICSQA